MAGEVRGRQGSRTSLFRLELRNDLSGLHQGAGLVQADALLQYEVVSNDSRNLHRLLVEHRR
jgi:hypothetical protein